MYHPTLVLNADYQPLSYHPLSVCGWEDAIRHVVKGTHVVVEEYDTLIRSPTVTMKQPAVIALKKYTQVTKHVAFTRFNLFLRDNFTCQYCAHKFPTRDLTFDHVVPRAKGGITTWENIATACRPCNMKKAANHQKPLNEPYKPSFYQLHEMGKRFPPNFLHETWVDYLFWDSELDES